MSSSVFKVYPPSPTSIAEEEGADRETSRAESSGSAGVLDTTSSVDEHLKIDSNLVIVVGKDGSVHVDQRTLHSLLANETNDTSVSVVRISSPTPSIEAEIEEERRLLQEQKLQQELESGTGSSDSGSGDSPESSNAAPSSGISKNETPANASTAGPSGVTTRRSNKPTVATKENVMLEDGEAPHVSMMVEGFYPPAEAKKFAEEVLTLAGLRKPLRVETRIDYEFQRYVVANDHCYTPLTSPSQKLPPRPFYEDLDSPIEIRSGDVIAIGEAQTATVQHQPGEGTSGTGRKRPTSKAPPTTPDDKSRRRKSIREATNDAEDLQSILEGSDADYSDDSSYPEEDDNDSDLDFSITGKSPKKRKSSSQSKTPKSVSKKEEAHESSKKKAVKTPKKSEPKTPTSMVNKTGIPRTYGPKRNLQTHMPGPPSPLPTAVTAAVTAVAAPAPAPVTVTVVHKKDHKKPAKPAHHVEALFSDMSSLFSTPDIIKKVGSGGRLGQQAGTATTTPVITPSTSNTVRGFVQLSPAIVRGPQKLPAHISIQTHTSASEEHDKRLDLIDSIVQQELNHPDPKLPLQQSSQPTMTEDIVKMLENNLPPGGVQEPVLPITDNSILAALGSNDEGLPEDLLQHVAELAEHKELQEILDKQVLGVMGPDNSITSPASLPTPSTPSTMNPTSITQHMQSSIVAPSTPSSTNPASLPTMTVKEQLMPRKEAIQIRRSDGRIITLPPIEAPATRSAKRRAQAGSSSSASTTPVSAVSHTTMASSASSTPTSAGHHVKSSKQSTKVSAGVVSYDDGSGSLMIDESRPSKGNRSGTSSRRTSESSSTSGRGKRQSTAAVAAVVAAAVEDDAESDESWNSEDDPDRLWCICMQPHNNRFMICCDMCEEWFHGKCVNVTKAMGQQMEEEGVEWSCPNCSKKKQEKQQPKMTEFLLSSNSSSTSISSIGGTLTTAPSTPPKVVAISMAGCVVCGKPSRTSSVYCSDECIRKHAGMANSSVATTTPLTSTASSSAHGSSSATKDKQNYTGKKQESLALSKGSAKADSIIVMERKTGRCLAGQNAPTAENLKAWLLSHPSFEVVPPGSAQAAIILAKQAEVRKLMLANEAQKKTSTVSAGARQSPATGPAKVQSQIKITDQKKLSLTSPTSQQKQQQQGHHTKPPVKTFSRVSAGTPTSKASSLASGTKSTTSTPKGSHTHSSASSTPNSSSSSEYGGKHQKKTPPEPKAATKHPAVPAGENIRVTVKKTLKEHLAQRTSEMPDKNATRLTDGEIEKFAEEIEEEMFALFNKDTGAKYRAKYRSLVFNIKDRKNLSLFQKICEKRIGAKQLVRMTPEELASQELAQWRENENKHQLEMIKKSELDLLACAKNYVLKTHKGEEVIEGKRTERLQLDPTTSVEDVVTVLNNSTVSSTSEVDSTLSPSKDNYRKDYDYHGKYSTGLYGSGPITSSTLSGSGTATAGSSSASSSTATAKKKESRRSRSRSRSHDRHKDRSRSRSKHKRRRSRSHDRHTSRSRDRDRHHRDHKSDHHKSEHKSEHHKSDHKSDHHHKKHDSRDSREKSESDKSNEIEASSSVSSEKDKNEALGKSVEAGKLHKKVDSKPQTLESFNLVDQILASAGSSGGKTDESTEKGDKAMPEKSKPVSAEQDQEPTSTVTIPTPPHSTSFDSESPTSDFSSTVPSSLSDEARNKALFVHWTGNVHMIDVASVEMSIRSVSGDVDDVMKEFPEDLNICGTIKPEIVLDYIGQIKKSFNKEVCLVRFHSNESAAYYTLYSHLFSRKRYSVVKSPTSVVKDFYIFPLPSGQTVPMILKPLRGTGIIEGDKKPDLLLGILVKIKGNRSGTPSASASPISGKNPRRQTKATASSSGSLAVSPSFALMQQVITKYATVNKKALVTDPESAVGSTPPSSPALASPSTSFANVVPSVSTAEPKATRTMSECSDHVDVDVDMDIIKAPIITKAAPVKEPIAAVVIDDDDDDEPYSPGGASNDSDHFADVTAIVETKASSLCDTEKDPIRREIDEINRKIAEEKNEIVGIINKAELKEDEIKATLVDPSLITDIAIPSNLSEILASIKSAPSSGSDNLKAKEAAKSTLSTSVPATEEDEEEYVPTSLYSSFKSGYGYGANKSQPESEPVKSSAGSGASTSRLAKLSEAELLSMVPDDSYLQSSSTSKSAIPVVELDSDDSVPPSKKSKWESSEPPPPGLEGEMDAD